MNDYYPSSKDYNFSINDWIKENSWIKKSKLYKNEKYKYEKVPVVNLYSNEFSNLDIILFYLKVVEFWGIQEYYYIDEFYVLLYSEKMSDEQRKLIENKFNIKLKVLENYSKFENMLINSNKLSLTKLLIDNNMHHYMNHDVLDEAVINAIKRENLEIIIFLLDNVDINVDNILQYAIESNNIEIVKLLVEKLAEIEDDHLEIAIKKGNVEIVKLLIDYRPIIYYNSLSRTLELAVKNNQPKIVKLLISEMEEYPESNEILLYAIYNEYFEIIKLLLPLFPRIDDIIMKNYLKEKFKENKFDLFRFVLEYNLIDSDFISSKNFSPMEKFPEDIQEIINPKLLFSKY